MLYSTFIPRKKEDAAGSAGPRPPATTNGTTQGSSPPGPPVVYEPSGRRFQLSPAGVDSWMGWSVAIGHRPTSGLSFWDIRFKGERIAYELSLQVGAGLQVPHMLGVVTGPSTFTLTPPCHTVPPPHSHLVCHFRHLAFSLSAGGV